MHRYESFVRALAQAIRDRDPMPAFPEGLTLDEAYALLSKVAELACDTRLHGLKAGLTNPDVAGFFGLDTPLLGLLYDWGECRRDSALACSNHSQIECEIGIRVDGRGRPVAIGPAIELVHLSFSRPEDCTAPNLVLCGLGSDRFLPGDQMPWKEVDFEALRHTTIRLLRDGEVLLEASPYDSLDGPGCGVEWCVTEAARRGITLPENALVLTGTCGHAIPMTPGHYVADYGPLGQVRFEASRPE